MKKINKMLVVLPLVLVFVLSSMPVFAWNDGADNLVVTVQYEEAGKPNVTFVSTLAFADLTEDDYGNGEGLGRASKEKVLKAIFDGTFVGDLYAQDKLEIISGLDTIITAVESKSTSGDIPATLRVKEKKAEKAKTFRVIALDVFTKDVVWTEIHELTNKSGANSWRDKAMEYYKWEVDRHNKLKDYYLVGYAPDDNSNVSDEERDLMKKYQGDGPEIELIIWVAEKMQPMSVTHIFPDRDPLYETIGVDYYVKINNEINNYNVAEYAKTRIQKMNEMGYVFEKAEYSPLVKRSGILEIAKDAYGRPLPTSFVIKGNGIFIYYKGAPIPAPVTDSEKKVDAASAQTGVQANVQQAVAPVAAAGQQQLPATGVADNAFLFLSSAALMALGIFFFKKH